VSSQYLVKQKSTKFLFRISQSGVLSFNKTVHWRIEHATPSLSWSERFHTSFLQHCGRRIPLNLMYLNPVDYSIWSVLHEKVYRSTIANISELAMRLINERGALSSRSWMLLSASGAVVSALVSEERDKLWAPSVKFQLFCHVSTKSYLI